MPGPLRPLIALAAVLVLVGLALPGFAAAQSMAVVGGEVHTGTGEVLEDATILIEDGKITAVGPGLEPPEGVEVLSAEGMVVSPGFIDAQTFLGVGPTSGGALINLVGEAGESVAPAARAADRFAENLAPLWLRSGVTAAYLAPDPRQLIGGTGAVVKLAGSAETAIVAEEAAVAASFGETAVGDTAPGREAPVGRTTRQGMIYDFRSVLIQAGEDSVEGEAGRVLGRLLASEIPLRMLVNSADDIETALRVAAEFDLRLADAGVPVVVGPSVIGIGNGGPMELKGHSPATAGILHHAGVRIALSTFGSRGRSVAMEAIVAWAHGLPREAALAAVTSEAAAILGVEDRIGSIAPGLDADLVIWDAHPIDTYARTAVVLVDGAVVFRR